MKKLEIDIPLTSVTLKVIPENAMQLLFSHGSGSSRFSPETEWLPN
jgi:hypothetical protein